MLINISKYIKVVCIIWFNLNSIAIINKCTSMETFYDKD